jgi:hypothetical protein
MDLSKIIPKLREELRLTEEALVALERLANFGAKPRRGRPPKRLTNPTLAPTLSDKADESSKSLGVH